MAKPVHHNAVSAVAETAETGVFRGMLGAAAGALLATAIVGGIPALLVATYMEGFGLAALLTGVVTSFMGSGVIVAGAAIGGGAGAIGGVSKRANRIHEEEVAAKNVGHGHDIQMMQQMAEVRQQAAEQYAKMGYAQGMQDGQVAVMQQLQQAAMQEAAQQSTKHREKILSERGMSLADKAVDTTPMDMPHASHADRAMAAKDKVTEQGLV